MYCNELCSVSRKKTAIVPSHIPSYTHPSVLRSSNTLMSNLMRTNYQPRGIRAVGLGQSLTYTV